MHTRCECTLAHVQLRIRQNFGNSSEIIQKLGKLFQINCARIFKNIYPWTLQVPSGWYRYPREGTGTPWGVPVLPRRFVLQADMPFDRGNIGMALLHYGLNYV